MHRLAHFLGREPDGRPLYRYKVPEERYQRLRTLLERELRYRDLSCADVELQALFCLYAAEWWRREYQGGSWAWSPLQRSIGISHQSWSSVTGAVSRGLKVLGRPLIHGEWGDRAFLLTLVCEGGLPISLIRKEGTALRAYCREVLEHLEQLGMSGDEPANALEKIAARYEHRLPKSLRRDIVHRLIGELVGRTWALRQELDPGENNPIRALDTKVPDWRERLPLVLSDNDADALLRGLMIDVVEIARGGSRLRVRCQLELSASSAQLHRFLELPATVTTRRLQELLDGQALPEGNRLSVTLRSESGDTLRVGALARAGDDTWASLPFGRSSFVGREACGLLTLLLAAHGVARESTTLDGGAALGALPWVFRPGSDGSSRWELAGTGSMRRREPELLVAVGEALEVTGGKLLEVSLEDRRLFRVTETLRVRTEDGLVTICAGQDCSDIGIYDLRGKRFEAVSSARTPWSGMPSLVRREGSEQKSVPLEVYEDGGWRPARPTDVGDLRVRARAGSELVFSASLRVLPRDLTLALGVGARGQPGRVVVRSQALQDAHIPGGESWQIERVREEGQVTFEVKAVGTPPPRLPLTLLFQFGRISGEIPFPIVTARFEGPGGLPVGESLHIKRLGGVRAVGLSPRPGARFRVTLQPVLPRNELAPAARSFDLDPTPTGEQSLDLRNVQAAALKLLDATEQLDASVRIELWEVGASGRRAALTVRRYDWELERDEATGDVLLTGASEDELSRVVVEARPFGDIGTAHVLEKVEGAARWRFEPEKRAAGSWLVTAREEGWYRCRPVPFSAQGAAGAPVEGLRALFELSHPVERLEAIERHLSEMCKAWSHPDWKVVEGFVRLLGDLPATTFDLIRAIAHHPLASAIVALRAARWLPGDLIEVLEGFEELIFLWEAIPFETWLTAFDLLHDEPARLLTEPAVSELAVSEVLSRGLALGERQIPVLVALHHWAHRRDARRPDPPREIPVDATFYRTSAEGFLVARQQAVEDFLRGHAATESWPTPRGALPPVGTLSIEVEDQAAHRRQVLDAPVVLALSAAGRVQLSRETTLFLEEVRAFAPSYFRDAFLFTFFALIARTHGA